MFWKWLAVFVVLSLAVEEVSAFGENNETWCCDSGYCCEDQNRACCGGAGHERCCSEGYQCCINQCVVPTCVCCPDGCYPPDYQCCEGGGACEVNYVCCPAGCCNPGSSCCSDWGCCEPGFYCCGLGCCEEGVDDPFNAVIRSIGKPRKRL